MIKKVGIVILNWNTRLLLQKFLPFLVKNTLSADTEIIIADNASQDDSVEWVRLNFPELHVISFDDNYGYAGGYNLALSGLKHEYFVLLNSDVEVTENWLGPLIDYMDSHSSCGALMPKILDYTNRNKFEYAGASGGFIDRFGYPFCRGRIFEEIEQDYGQYNSTSDIFWASGACLMIRAKLYHELNGLDEKFFAHMEEIDLCWRIKNRGYQIACVPGSVIYHVGGGTLSKNDSRKTYLNFRNNLILLYKNLPASSLNQVLFIRFWLDILASLYFIISGKSKDGMAIFRAYRDFYAMKSKFKNTRNTHEEIKLNFLSGIYQKSIVFDYYLRGKKKYSNLKGFNNN